MGKRHIPPAESTRSAGAFGPDVGTLLFVSIVIDLGTGAEHNSQNQRIRVEIRRARRKYGGNDLVAGKNWLAGVL